ncbi:hypothetical protein CR51_29645 [Caballeronia megalochromosomata]|nr:hypothetical protein CR51_29645 [Caballeronia megalochromosomata]
MALESSFRRSETPGAHQNLEDADALAGEPEPAVRPTGSGVSVTLWDEIAPAPSHTTPPLADDSPEA